MTAMSLTVVKWGKRNTHTVLRRSIGRAVWFGGGVLELPFGSSNRTNSRKYVHRAEPEPRQTCGSFILFQIPFSDSCILGLAISAFRKWENSSVFSSRRLWDHWKSRWIEDISIFVALVRSYLYTYVHMPSMKLQQKAKKHCSEKISFFSLPLNCTETFTSGKPDQRKGNVSLHIKTVFAFSGWNKAFPGDLTTRFLLSSLLLITFTCFVLEFLSKLLFSGLQKKEYFSKGDVARILRLSSLTAQMQNKLG